MAMNTTRAKQKILICLQACPMDIAQAKALIDLIVDCVQATGTAPSPYADLMLSVRYDTEFDRRILLRAGEAFCNVRTFRCRNKIEGWPASCNNVFIETLRYFCESSWDYSGAWFIEPDSVPLAVDFIQRVRDEWCATDKDVLGCFVGSFPGGAPGDGTAHVNGNLVASKNVMRVCPKIADSPRKIAWDAFARHEIVANAEPSRCIHSDYALGDPERNPWDGNPERLFSPKVQYPPHPLAGRPYFPAWLHGVKDMQALACVRERLLVAV